MQVTGLLHDIGKIGVDESILNKIGKLDKNEWEAMKLHSVKGARILENTIEFKDIAENVLSHHEHYDGSGYPKGLKGKEIPVMARIIAIADAYDAMTNDRTYRNKMSYEEAIIELKQYSGIQFDPEIVSLFISEVIPDIVSSLRSAGDKFPFINLKR
jgi:HD-GYP domain-containing protein (c-di-GMP phosphodiesterase class II)